MALFTTIVELVDARPDHYKRLKIEMESKGFTKYVTAKDGTKWLMPSRTYNLEGNLDENQVLTLAMIAADKLQMKYYILVTKSVGRAWNTN